MYLTIVILFTFLVLVYLITNEVQHIDLWIIFLSLLILILITIKLSCKNKPRETFVNSSTSVVTTTSMPDFVASPALRFTSTNNSVESREVKIQDILNRREYIDIEEDITNISPHLMIYNSAFNKKSYNGDGKYWRNISNAKPIDLNCKIEDFGLLSFDVAPNFSRKSGFFLGNARAIGPFSNNLGIKFHNSFTIILAVKHGKIDTTESELELLKMYANSPDNNALAFYISSNSVMTENNVQLGKLRFKFAHNPPIDCLINTTDDLIPIEKDVLTLYYIIKDIDKIRIISMNETDNTIKQLAESTVATKDITFSNKEMVINRFGNWNGSIYAFAIYDQAFPDSNVIAFYEHFMREYIKNVNSGFGNLIRYHNDVIDAIDSITSCKYDETTCKSCDSVVNWCEPHQKILASKQCREQIAQYCKNNQDKPECLCWNVKATASKMKECRLYRNIFSEEDDFLKNLTPEELEKVKEKYNLYDIDSCPKPLKANKLESTVYKDYDYERMKVKYKGDKDPLRIKTKYALESENDPEVSRIKIRRPDPDDEEVQEYDEVNHLSKPMTVGTIRRGSLPLDKTEDPAVQDLPKEKPKPDDTFFNRFMKVVMPNN